MIRRVIYRYRNWMFDIIITKRVKCSEKSINQAPGKKKYDTTGTFTDKKLDFSLNYNYEDKGKMEKFLEEV